MSVIYYQDTHVTLYLGDALTCHEWLKADVLVTDPPYGMNYQSNKPNGAKWAKHDLIEGDEDTTARDTVLDLWGTKPALVFGTWKQPKPAQTKNVLIWSKGIDPGMGDLKLPWGRSHEEIYVLGDGFTGTRTGSVIEYNKPNGNARPNHPTPKPVGLMEQLIRNTLGTIADPFAGSGTTLLAARNLNRHVIGYEIEERYCEVIAQRLSQQTFNFGGI